MYNDSETMATTVSLRKTAVCGCEKRVNVITKKQDFSTHKKVALRKLEKDHKDRRRWTASTSETL